MTERRDNFFFRCSQVVAVDAQDSNRCLAVDKVETILGYDYLIVHQLEASLSKCLALAILPLERGSCALIVILIAPFKKIKKKKKNNSYNLRNRETQL